MKLINKISSIFIGGTVGSIIALNLPIGLENHTKAAVHLAQTLSPEEINLRAKQTIVRIDGASVGSGTLIDYSDNTYTVLSNWHVMKNQGEYIVQTIDGRKHQIDSTSIKQLPGIDLVIFKFNSSQNYQIAELGDSSNLSEGQNVYFAGYPGELREEDNRYYRFFTANLVGILPKSTENGYSLVYSGEAFPGMSGGPVLNNNGLMIGVHGEANIHALSGGTSNYAIPINSYSTAIASLNTQPTETTDPAAEPATPTPEVADGSEAQTPEVIVEDPAQPEAEPPQPSTSPDSNVSSVPTFAPEPSPSSPPATADVATQPETPPQQAEIKPEPAELEEVDVSTATRKISLISPKTGIDYTKLRNLLREEKWSEADLHTYEIVEQVVKSAKQQNKHVFIELKTIAEFACPDIRTVDSLWKKYSDDKFGFSSQQEVWQSVNQKGDFSTQTWRRFATEVGWKTGEVSSGSGYLLHEELDFEPDKAPEGHLPWWFALPDEEQKVIKYLFARCNFNPTVEELEAEARSSNRAQNSANEGNEAAKEPNINKPPKSSKSSNRRADS